MMNINALILAAGSSSRMGTQKQLLKLGEQTILEHVIELTISIEFTKIIAVIGNEKDRIRNQIFIDDPRFIWAVNEEYIEGQSASIKAGVRTIDEEYVNVMIFLGDLPFIKKETAGHIYRAGLKELNEDKNPFIIQPVYKGMPGHPVFFGNMPNKCFDLLEGDKGAKVLIKSISSHIKIDVDDEGILFDIDTPEDYFEAEQMIKNEKQGK
ncbi:nucleotidyltransferase family protein [Oceanobacillus chungangensis]|uniref:MobA-like NTP transferase domain-containing protein n=1 Tax=Oceanobacillus chungangensis TaxID=1229152 RepID=A0A3D8PJI1_9BACI|nr:nucleotidyltransferase family protein [Oceanobacillus chungangensis]RDW15389.1 hypothetical protein CWR45_16510 [Oceanobacillus chungangensis]